MRKLVVAVVLGLTAVAAWAQGTAKPGVITVGFIPAEDSRAMVRQSQAILDIVAKHTGMKIDTFVGSDYNATIEALRAGHIDVALLGPFSYVLATTVAPVEAFAVTVIARTMQPSYQSIIIAGKDSNINSLADLKGKTFAFVDPGSTSGFMVPSAALDRKSTRLNSSHSQISYAVFCLKKKKKENKY